MTDESTRDFTLSRREAIAAGGAAVAVGSVLANESTAAATPTPARTVPASEIVGPEPREIALRVNGSTHRVTVEPRVSLLDALRERIRLTGTKKGCDHGECGACTVLVDGRRVKSCLTLAIMREGVEITTIEGLDGHRMQDSFIRHDAFQCGFCTPGQIMSAIGLLAERRRPSEEDIREGMSGNLCRCGAYPNIVAAIKDVAG